MARITAACNNFNKKIVGKTGKRFRRRLEAMVKTNSD